MAIQRALDLVEGRVMVITDVHGDWDIYRRYRDEFLDQKEKGNLQSFIITGDFIHNEDKRNDHSMDIIFDIMNLQRKYGSLSIVPLLGNHELPHIYGIILIRGESGECTSQWEQAWTKLSQADGQAVLNFFKSLPIYIRTKAGVMMCHAGASHSATLLNSMRILYELDHDKIIADIETTMNEYGRDKYLEEYKETVAYDYSETAQFFFSAISPSDPRYYYPARGRLFNKDKRFQLLWDALFAYNEKGEGENVYKAILNRFFLLWSKEAPYPQKILVAGHISVEQGFEIVCEHQLRLASYTHSIPPENGKYLIFDAGSDDLTMEKLVANIHPLIHLIH